MIPSGVKGPKDEERERAKKGEEGGERIKPKTYQDYNQWDKFVHKNLDQMLTDFDETDRQEQEEKHRLKLAEERKAYYTPPPLFSPLPERFQKSLLCFLQLGSCW